jgi:hypothetical protein
MIDGNTYFLNQYLNKEYKQEKEFQEYAPFCCKCNKQVSDTYYEIAGEIICEDCISKCKKDTYDYIDKIERGE